MIGHQEAAGRKFTVRFQRNTQTMDGLRTPAVQPQARSNVDTLPRSRKIRKCAQPCKAVEIRMASRKAARRRWAELWPDFVTAAEAVFVSFIMRSSIERIDWFEFAMPGGCAAYGTGRNSGYGSCVIRLYHTWCAGPQGTHPSYVMMRGIPNISSTVGGQSGFAHEDTGNSNIKPSFQARLDWCCGVGLCIGGGDRRSWTGQESVCRGCGGGEAGRIPLSHQLRVLPRVGCAGWRTRTGPYTGTQTAREF